MRTNIVHPGAEALQYEIRGIVEVAKKIEALGIPIIWENIGDPVAKGEPIAPWIREIVIETLKDDMAFAYSPTQGVIEAREYIAKERNLEGGIQITANDILFFNGLGDAISHIYGDLRSTARVIGPSPSYPTHSSAESAHAGLPHVTYRMDSENGWAPDLADMEKKIIENSDIAGILIVNPDNPTGYVYPEETLRKIVVLAKKYQLFIVSDEIYSNLFYTGSGMKKIASVIGNVPAVAMRGISKEFPWPGARCGWIEFYNRDKDAQFDRYAQSLVDAKMLEVCSTTLPQKVLPKVMSDPRYYPHLAARIARYEKRTEEAYQVLSQVPALSVIKARGAFYMSVVFKDGVLNPTQTLPISKDAETLIQPALETANLDKRFVYYLLASKGLCVVPLSSGFNSELNGFRFTLLEQDDAQFTKILETIRDAVNAYVAS